RRRPEAGGAGAGADRRGGAVSLLALLGAVGLTAVAAVAVLWPYQRGSAAALQRLPRPRAGGGGGAPPPPPPPLRGRAPAPPPPAPRPRRGPRGRQARRAGLPHGPGLRRGR